MCPTWELEYEMDMEEATSVVSANVLGTEAEAPGLSAYLVPGFLEG